MRSCIRDDKQRVAKPQWCGAGQSEVNPVST